MSNLKKVVIALSFVYAYVFLILVFPTQESVTLPGNTQSTASIFSIDDYDTVAMQTIYVINYEPLTYFQRAILELSTKAYIYESTTYEQSLSQYEMYLVGQIQKESAYHLATITAYEKADQEIRYNFLGLSLLSKPSDVSPFEIGDRFIEINGVPLEEETSLNMFYDDSVLNISLIRGSDLLNVTYERSTNDIPLYVTPSYQIISTSPAITLDGLSSFIGGPSSGMMMTLSIYATLKEIEIDVTLAGTGTIKTDGSIGPIGGLLQKYYTVIDNVDYMLVPSIQRDILDDVDTTKIVYVSTIDEAITFLERLQ